MYSTISGIHACMQSVLVVARKRELRRKSPPFLESPFRIHIAVFPTVPFVKASGVGRRMSLGSLVARRSCGSTPRLAPLNRDGGRDSSGGMVGGRKEGGVGSKKGGACNDCPFQDGSD